MYAASSFCEKGKRGERFVPASRCLPVGERWFACLSCLLGAVLLSQSEIHRGFFMGTFWIKPATDQPGSLPSLALRAAPPPPGALSRGV